MIARSSVTGIGSFIKPHGINGELSATIDPDVDIDSLKCIVVDIDGILVPIFIDSFRTRGSEAVLLKIDGITDENHAKLLAGKEIMALKEDVEMGEEAADGFYASDLIGWQITDGETVAGEIVDINDSTENMLFVVRRPDGNEVFIPIADELIEGVDSDRKRLMMNLPSGILDL